MPRLDRLIIADKQKYSMHWFKIWNETRKSSWDLVIDLRSSSLAYFISTKDKMIFKGNENEHKLKQLQLFIGSSKELTPKIWADEKKYQNLMGQKD